MASIEHFATVMRYMESAVSLSNERRPTKEQVAVYYDLLGDLPADLLMAAVKRSLIEHVFPTLPPPGLIRKHALALVAPPITTAEAWELCSKAARRWSAFREKEALESLPPVVAAAARAYGWRRLCDGSVSDTTTFAQFRDLYQTIDESCRIEQAMPPAVRADVGKIVAGIGVMPNQIESQK